MTEYIREYQKWVAAKTAGRKLVCFGAGKRFQRCLDLFDLEDRIEAFVDNNPETHGSLFHGKVIQSPEVIRSFKQGEAVVLITSMYYEEIGRQLDNDFGLRRNDTYFRLSEMAYCLDSCHLLLNFIDSLPANLFDDVDPRRDVERIGIVAENENNPLNYAYAIALFVILRKLGHDVTLVTSRNCTFYERQGYPGIEKDMVAQFDAAIAALRTKFTCLKITDIDYDSTEKSAELTEEDAMRVKDLSWAVAIQTKAYRRANSTSTDELASELGDIFPGYASAIKHFVANSGLSTLIVSTGMHFRSWLYVYFGHKAGLRVATYDGNNKRIYLASDGVATHNLDLKKVVRDNLFRPEERESILAAAKRHFSENVAAIWSEEDWPGFHSQRKTHSYQHPRLGERAELFDVVLPLNFTHDGPALMLPGCFRSFREWLLETVEYLLERTPAKILVRAHPAERLLSSIDFISYEDELRRTFAGTERLVYARPEDPINTYEAVERSRLVLPFASTVGIEAALMGKHVIMAQDCYYAGFGFVQKAESKEQYFELIARVLLYDEHYTLRDLDAAYMLYYMSKHYLLNTHFVDTDYWQGEDSWIHLSFDELMALDGVAETVQVLGAGIPYPLVYYHSGLWGTR